MKNNCVITFEGLNVNNFLNSLCKQNITILGVSKRGKQCILQVNATHSQKVVAQLKEKCYNILDVRYTGVSFGIQFVKIRFVLMAFVVLCVVLMAITSQYCLRIDVRGDFDRDVVCEALSQAGVRIGGRLNGLDLDVVENSVSASMNAMYAVVSRRGSVVYVNVVALKQIDAPIDMSHKRDLVATVDGVVTGILCEQGNPLVKVGDSVKKGDVIIEGRRLFNDGESRDVYALGKVTIQQSVQGSATFNGYKTEMQQTGNVCKKVGVVLFGKEYVNNCKYENFETSSAYKCLQPLNIALVYNTYYETQQVTVGCSIDECMEELREQAYADALNNCNFTPQDVVYAVDGNTVIVTLLTTTDLY